MKVLFGFLVFIIVSSCAKVQVKEPAILLDESTMQNVMYDVVLLQGIEGYQPHKLLEKNINPMTFIFEKYKIDSITFYDNQRYYAAQIKTYKKMTESVLQRLEIQKTKTDTLLKNQPLKILNRNKAERNR